MVPGLRRHDQIKIEAFRALSEGDLVKLQQVCQKPVVAIEAAHRVLTLGDVSEIGERLPTGSPKPGAATFLARDGKPFHTDNTSLDGRWRAT